jgi:deoxyadenosine/deoxycytidine kinase
MNKLIVIVGPSGVGKTSLTKALASGGGFKAALEDHRERPFQLLFKQDPKYALANQLDYLLFRAEQEKGLRQVGETALMDGGLEQDFHGFTRLFHARGMLTNGEFELCRRLYALTRGLLPPPDLIIALSAHPRIIRKRLAARSRINIATGEDILLLNNFLNEWLDSIDVDRILRLDVSTEKQDYAQSIPTIMERAAAI